MLLILTQLILWLLIGYGLWYILRKWIPKQFLVFLGTGLILLFLVEGFFRRQNPIAAVFWDILAAFTLQPICIALILIAIALFNGIKENKISLLAQRQIYVAVAILLISSIPLFANSLAGLYEKKVIESMALPTPKLSAIVLMGQGTTQTPLSDRSTIQLTEDGDRLLYTAKIYRTQVALGNPVPVIVNAGSRLEFDNNGKAISEGNDIARILTDLGVSPDKIILEPQGTDIRQAAVETRKILEQQIRIPKSNFEKQVTNPNIIVVGPALRMSRTKLAFSQLGINVYPKGTNFRSARMSSRRGWSINDFIPSTEALLTTTKVLQEFGSSIFYFLHGWISPVLI